MDLSVDWNSVFGPTIGRGSLAPGCLQYLHANLGHAAIRDPQSTRGATGKIENAVANPGTAVEDPHHN